MEGESTESHEKEEMKLFYVWVELNEKSMLSIVDSGATHNLLREEMV
jgi:hypothetical protein